MCLDAQQPAVDMEKEEREGRREERREGGREGEYLRSALPVEELDDLHVLREGGGESE
jgi:Mg-chelatase subunit ChlD